MYVNQSLKSCLVKFLATTAFKAKEFKDIRKMFIEAYPEFKAKKFYQKIYQTVRELQEYGFISVDNSTCTVLVKPRRTLLSENFHTPMDSFHCWLYEAV